MGRIRIDSHILDGNSNPEPTREIINNTFNVSCNASVHGKEISRSVCACACVYTFKEIVSRVECDVTEQLKMYIRRR